eukprot:TsM_000299800 transcript=TsM_000299800 gene=TsM_000299800
MYPRGKDIEDTAPTQKFCFWPRPEDAIRMEKMRRMRLREHCEEYPGESSEGSDGMDSIDLKNYGDADVCNVTDAEIFAAIFKELQPEKRAKKCVTRKSKPSRHTKNKEPPPNNNISETKITYKDCFTKMSEPPGQKPKKKLPPKHSISATKTTNVITRITALEFMRRNCVQKTSLRANPATTAAPKNLQKKPSLLSRPNPPPCTQSNLHLQTQNIARSEPLRCVLNLPPQSGSKCKRMHGSSSPILGRPHEQKRASIPKSVMQQAHKSPGSLPKSDSSRRRSKAPSVEIHDRQPKERYTMQDEPNILLKETNQSTLKKSLPRKKRIDMNSKKEKFAAT